jgi:hypothetical protein
MKVLFDFRVMPLSEYAKMMIESVSKVLPIFMWSERQLTQLPNLTPNEGVLLGCFSITQVLAYSAFPDAKAQQPKCSRVIEIEVQLFSDEYSLKRH